MFKDKNYTKEVILSALMLTILLVFMNPFNIFISVLMWMTLLWIFVGLFVVFTILIWTIKPLDEREEQHTTLASRLSFLTGSSVLTIGMIYESFQGTFDVWLPLTLGIMIVTKIGSLAYCRLKK